MLQSTCPYPLSIPSLKHQGRARNYFLGHPSPGMKKGDAKMDNVTVGVITTVGALLGGLVKSLFDHAIAIRNTNSSEKNTAKQVDTSLDIAWITDKQVFTKTLQEELEHMRVQIANNTANYTDQSKEISSLNKDTIRLERELNAAIIRADRSDSKIEQLVADGERQRRDYQETISEQSDEIVSLKGKVVELTSKNVFLQEQVDVLQSQMIINTNAIAQEVPVGSLETRREKL